MNNSMEMQDVIDEIKLELTGYVLDLEITDKDLERVVKKAMRELNEYWDETTMITVPFASCIDLSAASLNANKSDGSSTAEEVSAVVKIYRTESTGDIGSTVMTDPMYAQQWMLFSNGGTMYNLTDYLMNYASWVTLLQVKSTISTPLAFKEDRHNNKLYINEYLDTPSYITIEYVPKLTKVSLIKEDYWIDKLIRLSVALTKVVLGRIRTRFEQTNALWTQDGQRILEEGNSELNALREMLAQNSNLIYAVD